MLYKYLPSIYLENVFDYGEILFRNLTYFKQHECERRGDPLEGLHRDNPNDDVTITNLSTGRVTKGDYSFLNSIDSDLVYVFCLSNSYSEELHSEFESDVCIEITDPTEFIRRIRLKVRKLVSCHKKGLLDACVSYYKPNEAAVFNIKDPYKLPFSKDVSFLSQDEYRLVFGTKRAFKLKESLAMNGKYDFREEAMKGTIKDKIIKIGSLADIANIKSINT